MNDNCQERKANQMNANFAAVVYTPKQTDKSALPNFVKGLKARGVSVAGILQESSVQSGDSMRTIESVDIATGHRIPIKKPMKNEEDCGLDVTSLTETSAVLRNVLATEPNAVPDLVVVEKFGDQEQIGEGLLDEIMQIIAEGIPLLISVPEPALEIWQELSGDLGAVIDFEAGALQDWWKEIEAV
jgi:nucleoside-triphosphatase THEP1